MGRSSVDERYGANGSRRFRLQVSETPGWKASFGLLASLVLGNLRGGRARRKACIEIDHLAFSTAVVNGFQTLRLPNILSRYLFFAMPWHLRLAHIVKGNKFKSISESLGTLCTSLS